jgi:hypothetical protein
MLPKSVALYRGHRLVHDGGGSLMLDVGQDGLDDFVLHLGDVKLMIRRREVRDLRVTGDRDANFLEMLASLSIHLAMAAHADQDDVSFAQFQLQGDAVLQVDGD